MGRRGFLCFGSSMEKAGVPCLGIALWDCSTSVLTCLVYIRKRCTTPPPFPWVTHGDGAAPKPRSGESSALGPGGTIPGLDSTNPGLAGLIWVRDPRGFREQKRGQECSFSPWGGY